MNRLKNKVDEYQDLIESIFNDLHSIPEIGMKEYKTFQYLKNKMNESDVFSEIIEVGETGLIGVIDGSEPGPVVAIRADFDALEFEVNGEKVCKHACGHDAHSTMALVAAIIAGKAGIKKGTLKLVLQPGEEVLTGAMEMVNSGHLKDVDEMYGAHIRPIQEAKLGEAAAGLWHAASRMLHVNVKGKESHGARPHLGINAIDAGINIVNAVNSIHLNPASNFSVKCTKFKAGGSATNIVPSNCDMSFDLRAEFNDDMEVLLKKMEAAILHGGASVGATAKSVRVKGVHAATYDE
ncbi:MAG: amidohydrolase, partial [Dysgonamonadaceae bacterium]|nr:amidohydrolase [Dysgonamonadaceae bacterium]